MQTADDLKPREARQQNYSIINYRRPFSFPQAAVVSLRPAAIALCLWTTPDVASLKKQGMTIPPSDICAACHLNSSAGPLA